MALKDTVQKLRDFLSQIEKDLTKADKGNSAAAQRVRTATIKMEKLAKLYRKESVKETKKKKPAAKKKATEKKKPAAKKKTPAKKKPAAKNKTVAKKMPAAKKKAPAKKMLAAKRKTPAKSKKR